MTASPGKVLYVLKMFPRFSETFILNEILELERQGIQVHIVSIKQPRERLHHAKTARVRAPISYLPEPGAVPLRHPLGRLWCAWPLVRESWRHHRRDPERYRRALSALTGSSRVTTLTILWNLALGWLAPLAPRRGRKARKRFLLGGYLASVAIARNVRHLHAHFANDPTSVARFASLLSGIPFSFTAHAKDIYVNDPERLRHMITAAAFVVTCTDYNRAYLQKLSTHGTPIRRVYHGLDPDIFGEHPRRMRASSRTPLILSVGRLVEKKGHSSLIDACELLSRWGVDFRCEIVGEGPLEQRLRGQIGRLGLGERVVLEGFLPQERLVEKYGEASLFVLPCRITDNGDRDGIPNVLIEAMALGIPVVSSPVSGITELVDSPEVGVLVDAHETVQLAVALRAIVTQPHLFDTMAETARGKVRREFDLGANVAQLASLLHPARRAENHLSTSAPARCRVSATVGSR